jgi:hypothetical protein
LALDDPAQDPGWVAPGASSRARAGTRIAVAPPPPTSRRITRASYSGGRGGVMVRAGTEWTTLTVAALNAPELLIEITVTDCIPS